MDTIRNIFGKIFSCCCCKKNTGSILLGFGLHEIRVDLGKKPCNVFFCIKDPYNCIPTCHGDINKIGINTINDGFIIYADITTNTCLIEWACKF